MSKEDDPILAARSVAALMQAMDEVYGWTLPRSFPPGTALAELWAVPITVQKDPAAGVLYVASGSAPYRVAAILAGTMAAQILAAGPATAAVTTPPPTKEIPA